MKVCIFIGIYPNGSQSVIVEMLKLPWEKICRVGTSKAADALQKKRQGFQVYDMGKAIQKHIAHGLICGIGATTKKIKIMLAGVSVSARDGRSLKTFFMTWENNRLIIGWRGWTMKKGIHLTIAVGQPRKNKL